MLLIAAINMLSKYLFVYVLITSINKSCENPKSKSQNSLSTSNGMTSYVSIVVMITGKTKRR